MRESKTEYTITCDRCGHKVKFNDQNEEDMKVMSQWHTLGSGFFLFFGKSFDLCPECYTAFQEDFMTWLPSAFKKALEGDNEI